eukprot:CAMPEP_0196653752 /NCGR_PEP_ID=MMETSP1086-20130531/3401_1 /TAXON_ID=77921 /ORGANISM="Cyanoptyche  gloeocystis , Strain SAG4.97" /LENGTH=335 /DNA_ID=CAMNT_0041985103 /DNA_START=64 /DNA_END=1071 /DNA_ORIENTATION=-
MNFFNAGKQGAGRTKRITQQRMKEMTGRPLTSRDSEYEALVHETNAMEKQLHKISELSQRYVTHSIKYVTSRNELTAAFAASLGTDHDSPQIEQAALTLASQNEALKSILPVGGTGEKGGVLSAIPNTIFGVFGGKKKEKEESSAAERLEHLQQWESYFSKLKTKESELEDLRLELDYYKGKVHEHEKGTKTDKLKSATEKMQKFEHQYRSTVELLKTEMKIIKERRNEIFSFAVGGLLHLEQQLVSILAPVINAVNFNSFPERFSPEKLQELAVSRTPAIVEPAAAAAADVAAAGHLAAADVPATTVTPSAALLDASEKPATEAAPVTHETKPQ